jgi:hypothetical protein
MPGGRTCAEHGALRFLPHVSIGLALKAPPHVYRDAEVLGLASLVSAVVADGFLQGPLRAKTSFLKSSPSTVGGERGRRRREESMLRVGWM